MGGSGILETTALPPADYTIYFGIDGLLNGYVDRQYLYYDLVKITVQ